MATPAPPDGAEPRTPAAREQKSHPEVGEREVPHHRVAFSVACGHERGDLPQEIVARSTLPSSRTVPSKAGLRRRTPGGLDPLS